MSDVVGRSVTKIDALALATGEEKFVDDFERPGTAWAGLLYSPHASARIKSIDPSRALSIDGVHDVLSHENVTRVPHTTAGQGYPEPSPYDTVMFDETVRFVGDRVAAVLAASPALVREAIAALRVEYEPLPAVLDYEQAADASSPVVNEPDSGRGPFSFGDGETRNLAATVALAIGDVEAGLSEADRLFDHTYRTHYASHCMLEPHSVFTFLDERNRLVIYSSTQVPFHVRRICAAVLDIPIGTIRVIKPRIGGGFGGKQEVFLEYIPALFTLRTGKPVKLVLSRKEVFVSSRTRHPMRIRMRSGLKNDGTITAIDHDVLMNTGAYGSHALTVLSNAGSKVLPLFNKVENVRFSGRTVYTNLPVGGAYRGYGATQSCFAFGQQVDMMARAAGIDVVDFYSRHQIREGETSAIFEALGEGKAGVEMTIRSCGLEECLRLGAEAIGWKEKRGARERRGPWIRGVGMVGLMQGSSIPRIDMGSASIKMNEDGSFNLLAGATDLGTGSDTILAQIVAEVLGVGVEKVIVYSSDTDMTPFDTGAYASSTTYLSGEAVRRCAEKVKVLIIDVAAAMSGKPADGFELRNGNALSGDLEIPLPAIASHATYRRDQFQIQAQASHVTEASPPPFSTHFAEVEVDRETGRVRVVDYVAAVDCGRALNPALAEGQIEGSVVNGISFALTEEYLFNSRGAMTNPSFGRYKIFTAADIPKIRTILVGTHEPTGPYGAKSVSEICINGPLPAIANAIRDAVGIRLFESPFSPERVLRAMEQR